MSDQKKLSNSKVWIQNLEDSMKDRYGYESQQLFLEEALSILNKTFSYYEKYQMKFDKDDRSFEKAIWMLHLDALDTLRDCIFLLKDKKHRVVGKMFRDIAECLDLAALFWWERDSGSIHLKMWYDDKVIPHRKFRKYLNKVKGEEIMREAQDIYDSLSKWTHHCYSTLLNSYSLSGSNLQHLVYDSHSRVLVLPETISLYVWKIKDLMLYFLGNIKMVGLIDWNDFLIFLNKTIRGLKFT
jgi:hypothetical protein